MNVKQIVTSVVVGLAMGAFALDHVEVIDVKARQRYPWNGLVDIDFELDSKATEPYQMKVTVFDNVGKTNLNVKSVYTENVSYADNPCMVTKDTSRIVWDAAADLPEGFKCSNVLVTCQDMRARADDPKLYMVIDLSAGSAATSYPISYLAAVPEGGWSNEYKTKKIALRKVAPGDFMMGSPNTEMGRYTNEDCHRVTISKAFYISVFELTQAQLSRIGGAASDSMFPATVTYAMLRGADIDNRSFVSYGGGSAGKLGDCVWPTNNKVPADSYIGKLRSRTGIANLDLPLEAQWEYACRGGSMTALESGLPYVDDNINCSGRWSGNRSDGKGSVSYTTKTDVGLYAPNALGLYDMIGNEEEWCKDVYVQNLGAQSVVDPQGGGVVASEFFYSASGNDTPHYYSIARVVKGGFWNSNNQRCRPAFRAYKPSNPPYTTLYNREGLEDSHYWIGVSVGWLGTSITGYADDPSGLYRHVAAIRIVCPAE